MKKLAAVMLVVAAVLSVSCAFADDGEKMTVDDVKFGTAYKIKGFGVVTFTEFSFIDKMNVQDVSNIESGNEADVAYLKADIRNLGKKEAKFKGTFSVRAVYDDEYDYSGFAGQFDYDRTNRVYLNQDFPIGPMYTGHYGFFCALPNFVVQDKTSPLRMIITINGHEFTYNIRK